MALITCSECGHQVSDKATACPGCGAPRDVLLEPASASADAADDATESHWTIQAATDSNGHILFYDEASCAFALNGAILTLAAVYAIDRAKRFTWTRLDVRAVMRKSAKSNTPMGDLPVWEGPSALERSTAFLGKLGDAMAPKSAAMVCPHCQSKGTVSTKQVKQKKGISGGKATAAVVTGGLSILATGLSRKEDVTEAHCRNCGNTWRF
ncbi:MAG: zinc ribbon domain-containing protein [Actinomycetota bacterium]|nr:zinc ribbon domain-containing protein [Actinomycetota bacterium]